MREEIIKRAAKSALGDLKLTRDEIGTLAGNPETFKHISTYAEPMSNDMYRLYQGDRATFNDMMVMEKQIAKAKSTRPPMSRALLVGMGIIGASVLAEQIVEFFSKQYKKYKSKEYFEKMLEMHPNLQKEDPIEVAKYWESLYHFSPNMAQDPLAAGAYITQSLSRISRTELGGPPPDTFSTLADIQKKSKEGKIQKDQTASGARSTAVGEVIRGLYS